MSIGTRKTRSSGSPESGFQEKMITSFEFSFLQRIKSVDRVVSPPAAESLVHQMWRVVRSGVYNDTIDVKWPLVVHGQNFGR